MMRRMIGGGTSMIMVLVMVMNNKDRGIMVPALGDDCDGGVVNSPDL